MKILLGAAAIFSVLKFPKRQQVVNPQIENAKYRVVHKSMPASFFCHGFVKG